MLVVRGDTELADVYVGEFLRLFRHFYARNFVVRQCAAIAARAEAAERAKFHLVADDSWARPFFEPGTVRAKERVAFAGT